MEHVSAERAILAGLIATPVMTMMAYAGPIFGLPKADLAAMLGSKIVGSAAEPMTAGWWTGMSVHLVSGAVVFPLIYAFVLFSLIPGPAWLRGASWGIALWFLSQSIVMPLLGAGFFSYHTSSPNLSVLASLAGHLLYGSLLGLLAAPEPAPAGPPGRRAARV